MPIDQGSLAVHIAEHGPYLFHVTDGKHRDGIMREGLRPGSDLGHYVREDFFRTRPGRVYLCDARTIPFVAVAGDRITFRVDLRQLDLVHFGTDEDAARDADLKGEPWFSVPTPERTMLADDSEAPGQEGRLADWIESIPERDEPAHAKRSLAAGRMAYGAIVPTEALQVVEHPSDVVQTFIRGAEEALSLRDLRPGPGLAYYEVETTRAIAIARAILDAGLAALGCPALAADRDLAQPLQARRIEEDIRRVSLEKIHAGQVEPCDLGSALADLVHAVYELDRALGWDRDACIQIAREAANCLPHIAKVAGDGHARTTAGAAIQSVA